MKNKEKKVIILDKLSSPFVAQAIIILKEGAEAEEESIIKEAEKIVEGYFPRIRKNPSPKKHRFLSEGIFLLSGIILTVILMRLF